MILLATTKHDEIAAVHARYPNLGRLVIPQQYGRIADTAAAGIPWAADNGCYVRLDEPALTRMLAALDGLPGCRFVCCPDVVGNAAATLALWHTWRPRLEGFPAAFVLQDGIAADRVPWPELDAVFVGGSTEFKLSPLAAELVAEARARGAWAHMGRVNSHRRIAYARAIGCDSIDGTKWARWSDTWLRAGVRSAAQPAQLILEAS